MSLPDHVEVLTCWFGELSGGFADSAHRKRWFSGGAEFDAELNDKFSGLVSAALAGRLEAWRETPRARLAYVLVCDQLTRNIHRGRAEAFSGDTRALGAAREAIDRRQDTLLAPDERAFFYMPFEHSESLIDQHTCVGLFSALRDQCPGDRKALVDGFLQHAMAHRDIIREFGRFPHRNALLGRASTDAELRFLAKARSFGQKPG